jgi:ABC-type polar amino acid transport system ATPase subunit
MTGVNKWFGDVLRDINLKVGRGERVVIWGPRAPASRRSFAVSTGLRSTKGPHPRRRDGAQC